MVENHGNLFIIPSSIEQLENVPFLLEEQKKLLYNIKYFIVENEKVSRKTIKELNLKTKLQSIMLFKHNDILSNLDKYFIPIYNGEDMGLLSDSGTPCIADPGSKIVEYAHLKNIKIQPLVGPSSIILSLMASGFNGQNFKFHGYIPKNSHDKENYIKKMMRSIQKERETQIFIETPYRNQKLLYEFLKVLNNNTYLCIAKNIGSNNEYIKTKKIHEWKKLKFTIDKEPTIFVFHSGEIIS